MTDAPLPDEGKGRRGVDVALRASLGRYLRLTGLSYSEIGDALGTSVTTVHRMMSAENTAREQGRARRYKAEHREQVRAAAKASTRSAKYRCRECGGPMSRFSRSDGVCMPCRSHRAEEKRDAIASMWNAGFRIEDIANTLDMPVGSVSGMSDKLRADGRIKPRRGTDEQR